MTKCKICSEKCNKIGELNRFNDRKVYCCMCYAGTDHRIKFNPTFDIKDFCNECKENQSLAGAEQQYYNSF